MKRPCNGNYKDTLQKRFIFSKVGKIHRWLDLAKPNQSITHFEKFPKSHILMILSNISFYSILQHNPDKENQPSIRTRRISFKIVIVVIKTRTEKRKVEIGSAITHVGCMK